MAFLADTFLPSSPAPGRERARPLVDISPASTDTEETIVHTKHGLLAPPSTLHTPAGSPQTDYLIPSNFHSPRSSPVSSRYSTPLVSRSTSPLPQFFVSRYAASGMAAESSDSDTEIMTPLVRTDPTAKTRWREGEQRRWWTLSKPRRKRHGRLIRFSQRFLRRLVPYSCYPRQPLTILLTLVLLSAFAVSSTLALMYILNPDKDPLPWRGYCSIPSMASPPDNDYGLHLPSDLSFTGDAYPHFPPDNFETLPPAGVFIGVFTVDSAFERRSLIRTSWASHPRSREGAGEGDGGLGTSRSIVRFIMGQPGKDYERRVQLEIEMYNDIVVLPMKENMNSGKTHTFFSWASINAWVPPVYLDTPSPLPPFSYSNYSTSPPHLASHDPLYAWSSQVSDEPKHWVRPDFVLKVDDDAFVMIAELEARLRVELYKPVEKKRGGRYPAPRQQQRDNAPFVVPPSSSFTDAPNDPLIYWGYLVTNRLHRFMAGELYALSWSLVDWVAKDPTVKGMTRGAEDKQTAQWMRLHPQARNVRWASERCWIYDHPRSGTVYSHGFLFPSEARDVRETLTYPVRDPPPVMDLARPAENSLVTMATPSSWAFSTVSTFGVRYTPPLADLPTMYTVEAMVEGSDMSRIGEGSPLTPENAWIHRDGRRTRYEGKRLGGTIVVHFVKQNMWFLETALAMLEGDEETTYEKFHRNGAWSTPAGSPPHPPVPSNSLLYSSHSHLRSAERQRKLHAQL